ncbi:hypothetical protein PV04_00361 [Phialophora macrospora]|uniref:Uncharacterized protein n=1 Tax=Phialophora macrospora TaxID=1851006 RepID=A0A0D2D3N9_9EURO|nr:hypothetical protein PV04_00361 [Phialophora macrospora]
MNQRRRFPQRSTSSSPSKSHDQTPLALHQGGCGGACVEDRRSPENVGHITIDRIAGCLSNRSTALACPSHDALGVPKAENIASTVRGGTSMHANHAFGNPKHLPDAD